MFDFTELALILRSECEYLVSECSQLFQDQIFYIFHDDSLSGDKPRLNDSAGLRNKKRASEDARQVLHYARENPCINLERVLHAD